MVTMVCFPFVEGMLQMYSEQFNSSSRSPFTWQTLFDCNLTTVAMTATAFNISKAEYSHLR